MVLQSREASLGEMCHHGHRQPQWGFEGKKRELSFYIWKTKWVLALTDFQGDESSVPHDLAYMLWDREVDTR